MRIYDYSNSPATNTKAWVKKIKRFFRNINRKQALTWILRLTAAGVLFIALLFVYYSRALPDPNRLLGRNVPESTKIYDRNGGLLYEVHGEVKRTLVKLDQVSPDLQHATIAIEDKDFYKHGGISITGTLRSALVDVASGQAKQGGSTITQQFVKNAVLTRDKSILRKIKEIILSIEIEARFSKNDILKLYLNEIPYGRNAYGVEAAAETYFNTTADKLSLAQAAYLAAIPQAPTYYSPTGPHFDALQSRQHLVLQRMKDQNYINDSQYQAALNDKVTFVPVSNSIKAPHFVMFVQDYLANKYGESTLENGGLKVYTTLDPELQTAAEAAVKSGVDNFSKKYNANNAALVATDPKTGQILAMVGSKDYFGESTPAGCTPGKNCLFEPNVNVATSQRQPGSSFKPYAYITAVGPDFKYAPASVLIDVVTNFGSYGGKDYVPHNYSGESNGPVSMRKALAGSLNIPAVKTLALVGVNNVTEIARKLGITSSLQNCGLSLVLGGCEVRLVDHVAAFGAIANMGDKHQQTAIMKIEGQDGKIMEEFKDKHQQIVDPQAAYELINIMTDNNARAYVFGATSPLAYPGQQVACKTGTTQSWHDGWTMCFTPNLSVGVWSGNNDGTLMKPGSDGVFTAAPIVKTFMNTALGKRPKEDFKEPQGITHVTIDNLSGKLPSQYSSDTKSEVFADYSVPKDYDNVHVSVKIDSTTGLPANSSTPPENIVDKIFTVLHSEKPDTPSWENPVRAWALAHGYSYPGSTPVVTPPNDLQIEITQPLKDVIITQSPFVVTVKTTGNNIAKVDITIDGEFIVSGTTAPYAFQINKKYADGAHTITATATDNQGNTVDASTTVTISAPQPLVMSQPNDGALLIMPAGLMASASAQYTQVIFYYQTGSIIKAIGPGIISGNSKDGYKYSVQWADNKIKLGKYSLFAKSDTGVTTPKISVTVGQ